MLEHPREERRPRFRLLILRRRQDEAEGGEPRAIEAGVHVHQVPEAAQEQSGAGDEDDGERDFGHHERASRARRAVPAVVRVPPSFSAP